MIRETDNQTATNTTATGSKNKKEYQKLLPLTSEHNKGALLELVTWNNMTPYVIQGLYYFLRHQILWRTSLCPILWTLVFVICAFLFLLPVAFVPQALVLSTTMTPWLGWPLAFLLAFLEMLVIVMIFSAVVLLSITDKLFDEVLVLRGHGQLLVDAEEQLKNDRYRCCRTLFCGGCGCCNLVSILQLVVSIITLPLNLIPVAGTVLWLFLNGRLYAWGAQSHYFYELKHQSFRAQRRFVGRQWYKYHLFGMQAMALELIPFVNVLFVFTNAVAAALWAADMEDQYKATAAMATQPEMTMAATTTAPNSYPTEETILQPTAGVDNYYRS